MDEVLRCGDDNKVVCHLVRQYKVAVYASLVQGTLREIISQIE